MMRIESNHARRTFQQLRLAVRLTYKLYALYYRIEAIKSRLEVCFTPLSLPLIQSIMASQLAVDEQQIAIADSESTTSIMVPVTQSVRIYHLILSRAFTITMGPSAIASLIIRIFRCQLLLS